MSAHVLRRFDLALLLLALVVLNLLVSAAQATSFRELSLAEMAAKAELAFFGTVESVVVEARDGEPWTRVTFVVGEALAGETGESLELLFYGGSLADVGRLNVIGMPQFTAGEQVLVLAYDAPYFSPLVGFSQGLWRLEGQGLQDERGRILSLDEAGTLAPDGAGGGTQEILAALRALLEEAP